MSEQPEIKDKLRRVTAQEEQGLGRGYREMLGQLDPFVAMTDPLEQVRKEIGFWRNRNLSPTTND